MRDATASPRRTPGTDNPLPNDPGSGVRGEGRRAGLGSGNNEVLDTKGVGKESVLTGLAILGDTSLG
jgi:hypothetical protein